MTENETFSLKAFKLKDCDLNIHTHYNEDFAPHYQKICSSLSQENSKGLVLLYGQPGKW